MNAKTYCRYPFKELALKEWQGSKLKYAWPCCMMGNYGFKGLHNPLGFDPKDLTPQEIYDHPRMQQLRDNLANGVKDEACQVCWDQEDKGLKSFRNFSNEIVNEEPGLEVIDITASNICNLRCRMCTPTSSNSLMEDNKFLMDLATSEGKRDLFYRDQLKEVTKFWGILDEPIRAVESIQWDWMMNNTDKIKVLKASGGEPFYDKKVLKLLERYIETGNAKNTKLEFHTNGTQINDSLIELLGNFKENYHTFSIDGYDKVYEYIRFPGNFADLDKNLRKFCKLENVYWFKTAIVVSALNVLNLDQYITWVNDVQHWSRNTITFSEIYGFDRGTSLSRLPVHLLEEAKRRVDKFKFINDNENQKIVNLIKMIDDAIINNKQDKQLMKKEIWLCDVSRKQSYKNHLDPLLIEWLDHE